MAYSIDEIIAIDPGPTTGFVHFKLNDENDRPFNPITWREIEWEEHWGFLYNVQKALEANQKSSNHLVVVVENYRLYAHEVAHQINSDFPSSQIIGVMKYITAITRTELVLQMASVMQQFPSSELRKWLPLNTRLPTSLHILDAISHAMYLYFDRRLK